MVGVSCLCCVAQLFFTQKKNSITFEIDIHCLNRGMRHVNPRAVYLFFGILRPTTPQTVRRRGLSYGTTSFIRCRECGRIAPSWPVMSSFIAPSHRSSLSSRQKLSGVLRLLSTAPNESSSSSSSFFSSSSSPNPTSSSSSSDTVHRSRQLAELAYATEKLARKGKASEALDQYFQLLNKGGFPNRETLHRLALSLYRSQNLVGMTALHDTVVVYYQSNRISNRRADALRYIYTMFIQMLVSRPPVHLPTIKKLYDEMAAFGVRGNVVLYNILLKFFLDHKDTAAADALFKDLLAKNLKPTIYTYSILLTAAVRQRDFRQVESWLDDMLRRGIRPDRGIVSGMVTTLCFLNERDAAVRLIEALFRYDQSHYLIGTKFRQDLLLYVKRRRRISRRYMQKRWGRRQQDKRKKKSAITFVK
ncbi:uncharacterized protein BYT42DRAFT_575998 [Radiomyces spectabilis]|uniref:uncharacterized protein n=1 Tax=Radiomyces spectabilis TaxID=64574 RepID=UPI00221F8B06|nr:uncharacterized protein BYT42DRAFT_575998 [Radiomyces spectabilis]KAI8374338.1 hypothetical protein BYT42DRAFT_575998 [Radiomyces spectabilis]